MKKLLLLPTILFPYLLCLCLGYGFVVKRFLTGDPVLTALSLLCLVCLIIAPVTTAVYLWISKNDDPRDLLRTALRVKLLHIPTYLAIFVLGLLMAIMLFFTFPFILFLIFLDWLTLILTAAISIPAAAKFKQNQPLLTVLTIFFQFFFCTDIIALIALNQTVKR
ncbi:MAG: hypothetical protein J6R04_00090 [Clostridia bacterium]|nr:hypothetical protein [Clostridia bacterium]